MKKTILQMIVPILFMLFLAACENEMEKHTERPDWLQGNAYEVLGNKGNYTLFLQGLERSGLRDVVDGKGLCTVFAPDDEAMKRYLNGKSLEEISLNDLKVLIGMHIVQYSFNTGQLLNFQHWGDGNSMTVPAGTEYKQRTFGKENISEMTNPHSGRKLKVYHREKYLPILSTRLFETRKLGNSEADYAFFFPGSKWYGMDDKLYVANAGITEYGIPTDNGYLYLLDDVVKPLRTIYSLMLDKSDDYSVFRDLYDRFSELKYDAAISKDYAATGDSLFLFNHKEMPKIASEWTNDNGDALVSLTSVTFNMLTPDNTAMQSFLTGFFEGNYASWKDIPLLTSFYLAKNHVKEGGVVFPDNIRQGETSLYGDKLDLNVEQDVRYKEFCSNGLFYGINKVIIPAMFRSVTAPVFKSDDYSIFAYMLHKSKELTQLINMENEYTLFIPTNQVFQEQMHLRLNYGDGIWGSEKLERETDPGKWATVSDAEMIEIAQQHIILEKIEDFQYQRIWRTKGNLTYVVTDNDEVKGEGSEGVVPAKNWTELENGAAYEIHTILKKSENSLVKTLNMSGRFTQFYAKLVEAGLIDKDGMMVSLGGEQAVVLALDDAAMDQLTLPTDKAKLADFMSYYFISLGVNKLADYILPGYQMNGNYQTLMIDRTLSTPYETIYKTVEVEVGEHQLRLKNASGEVTTEAVVPTFASDGVIYTLTAPFRPE